MISKYDIVQIKKLINEKCVSTVMFDYFDTLVSRSVKASDMTRIWAFYLSNMLLENGFFINPDELEKLRKNALKIAHIALDYTNEPCYRELCSLMYSELENQTVDFKTFYEFSLLAEIRGELNVQYTTEDIKELLFFLKNTGIHIYLVSDFYLPIIAFESFFEKHGFANLFDSMYISSELDLRKSNSTMYENIGKEIVDRKNILMVGDNEVSDKINPSKLGFLSYRVNNHSESQKCLLSRSAIEKQITKYLTYYDGVFMDYSLTLYLFLEKLLDHVKYKKITKLYFLSREGEFLKQLFDTFCMYNNVSVETFYLCVSRYALSNVLVDHTQKDNFYLYLNHLGIDDKTELINIVDVGWKGTMQDMLSDILPNCKINGFYIGTNEKAVLDNESTKNGLVFSFYPQKSQFYDVFSTETFLQEELLVASHGTTTAYSEDGMPIFENNDSCLKAYYYLQPMRKELIAIIPILHSLLINNYCKMGTFEFLCAKKYLRMILNRDKTSTTFRHMLHFKDKNEIIRIKKENRWENLINQIKYCRKIDASTIKYYYVSRIYIHMLHIRPIDSAVSKLVELIECHRIKKKSGGLYEND